MEEWKEYRISDICTGIYEGPHATPKESQTGAIYLGIPAISEDGHIDFKSAKRIAEEDLPLWTKRVTPQKDDIVFTNEATLNLYALIPEGFHGCLGRRLGLVRPNKDIVNAKFLFYYFFSPEWRNTISQNKVYGATVERILMTKFPSFPVRLPNKTVQDKIVDILSSFDDKIEVNKRLNDNFTVKLLVKLFIKWVLYTLINDNLLNQSNALFKSFFIDFEPFRDGEFTETDMGVIPKGWQVVSLISIARYLNGLAMQNFRPEGNDKGLPVLKIKELGQGMSDSSSDRCSSDIDKQYIVNDGDVVFSWSGTLLVDLWCGGQCGLNQHLFKVSSKDYPKWFYYMWTKQHLNNFIQIAKDKAVTMGHIKRGHLEEAKVLVPTKSAMNTMTAIMQPIIDEIIDSRIESRRLSQLRDALLPRLMSGELKVDSLTDV